MVVLGPTASGKTALAIELAQQFAGEIVSADSRAIYRETDLGTAKPTAAELAAAPHHLVSVFPPSRAVSVAEYRQLSEQKIGEIHARGRLPILAGSHTLLISALVENYIFPPPANPAEQLLRRTAIEQEVAADPAAAHARLAQLAPKTAAKIPPANRHHLARALFLAEKYGEPTAVKQKGARPFDTLLLGLAPAREVLYAKINARVDAMLAAGLLAEVTALATKYDRHSPALRGHGYRELLDYLAGEKSLERVVEEIKQNTRHYAKRQLTWWRSSPLAAEIHWLPAE